MSAKETTAAFLIILSATIFFSSVKRRPLSPRVLKQVAFFLSAMRVSPEAYRDFSNLESSINRENAFFRSIGLKPESIEAISEHERIAIGLLAKAASDRTPASDSYKNRIIQWHIAWMNAFLGPENFNRFLETSSSTISRKISRKSATH